MGMTLNAETMKSMRNMKTNVPFEEKSKLVITQSEVVYKLEAETRDEAEDEVEIEETEGIRRIEIENDE